MKQIAYFLFLISILSCSGLTNRRNLFLEGATLFQAHKTSKEHVLAKFGKPDKKVVLPKNVFKSKGILENWGYKKGEFVRLHITFWDNQLYSVSYDIFEEDPEYDLQYLLSKVSGNFTVVPEPQSNPHVLSSNCELVDEEKGVSILVNGYKKSASVLSFWEPELKSKIKQLKTSDSEYCVAGHCSKFNSLKSYKSNHCKWLEKLVLKYQKSSY